MLGAHAFLIIVNATVADSAASRRKSMMKQQILLPEHSPRMVAQSYSSGHCSMLDDSISHLCRFDRTDAAAMIRQLLRYSIIHGHLQDGHARYVVVLLHAIIEVSMQL